MNIFRKKNNRYSAFITVIVNTAKCNLNCSYCFQNLSQSYFDLMGIDAEKRAANGRKSILEFDISSFLKTLEKTKQTFCVSLGGEEPFLASNIIEICQNTTKEHHIRLSSNMTSPHWKDFVKVVDPGKVFMILASAHIEELNKRNLLDIYISNFLSCREKGFRIIAAEVAHPNLVTKVDEYKSLFKSRGIDLKFMAFQGIYKGNFYPYAYTDKDLKIFGLSAQLKAKCRRKDELCNAGYNVAFTDSEGFVYPCAHFFYSSDNNKYKLGNIHTGFNFRKHMLRCPFEACSCPMKTIDKRLFDEAVRKTGAACSNTFF